MYYDYLGQQIGWVKKQYFGVRPIPLDICERVSKALPNFGNNHVQVLVKFLGELIWINIGKSDLIKE